MARLFCDQALQADWRWQYYLLLLLGVQRENKLLLIFETFQWRVWGPSEELGGRRAGGGTETTFKMKIHFLVIVIKFIFFFFRASYKEMWLQGISCYKCLLSAWKNGMQPLSQQFEIDKWSSYVHLHTCTHLVLKGTFNSPSILTASPRTLPDERNLGLGLFCFNFQESTSKGTYLLSSVIS